ncbi:ribonuclease III [Pilatotrama ljubarskyi]|nr:ribonuclease III [Pilatotrama ljubarskyi]
MVSHSVLQQSIREAISRPDFDAALPPLSDQTWMRILTFTPQAHAENERLEFLGDALMYATIGRQLYAQFPHGTPHLYTCVRAALHSNMTFAMLAEKLDIMAVSSTVLRALTRKTFGEGTAAPAKSRPQIKATADLFETVIGAYYLDYGFEALYAWVQEIYTPIIQATVKTFYATSGKSRAAHQNQVGYRDPQTFSINWNSEARQLVPAPQKERLLLTPVQQIKRAVKKLRATHAARAVRRSPKLKMTVIGHPSLPPKPTLAPPLIRSKASSSKADSKTAIQASPMARNAAPIFIDLTVDSGSDVERETIFRHPLVTPRIPRRTPAVSKLPTPAAAAIPAADTGTDSNSELEDETMLETMLTAEGTFSDMDCGSSDVESPARPSNLAPYLTRFGLDESPLQVGPAPVLPRRSVFLK